MLHTIHLTHCGLVTPHNNKKWINTARVMACCLMAPSHHLNQCWVIIKFSDNHVNLLACTDTPRHWHIRHHASHHTRKHTQVLSSGIFLRKVMKSYFDDMDDGWYYWSWNYYTYLIIRPSQKILSMCCHCDAFDWCVCTYLMLMRHHSCFVHTMQWKYWLAFGGSVSSTKEKCFGSHAFTDILYHNSKFFEKL